MPTPFTSNRMLRLSRSALGRTLLCVCTLILAFQLLGARIHRHDAAELAPDCVACHYAGQFTADLPAAAPALLAVFLVLAYVLARLPRHAVVSPRRYLIPMRQAPPRADFALFPPPRN
jgi:hypothetical protein